MMHRMKRFHRLELDEKQISNDEISPESHLQIFGPVLKRDGHFPGIRNLSFLKLFANTDGIHAFQKTGTKRSVNLKD